MNRNSDALFSQNPISTEIPRSIFPRPFTHKTTFDMGKLIPIFHSEILPGDTVSIDMGAAIRMATPIYPIMDNLFADFYFFFVPNRLIWEHWPEFMGENKLTAWEQPIDYEIPQIEAPEGGWEKGTIADYMGIPTYVDGFSISALPFRAIAMIWSEWFRDQNLKDAAQYNIDETTITGSNGTDYVTDVQKGGMPPATAKLHDYFTSLLPQPQKGEAVSLPIAEITGTGAVYGNGMALGLYSTNALDATAKNFGLQTGSNSVAYSLYADTSAYGLNAGVENTSRDGKTSTINQTVGITTDPEKSGMVTDIEASATPITINELRQAFAIQRMLEKDARGGTRYTEIIRSHFGVISPDARMQRPEYLGGTRLPINIDQVLQTSGAIQSEDISTTPQGTAAAYSLTNMAGHMMTKSFTEHGQLIGFVTVRQHHTYQQGLERKWSRKHRFDFYWPTLANLGEMGVKNREIYLQSDEVVDEDTDEIVNDQVMGYQEAWADYRYMPDRVSGQFRSNAPDGSLDVWHLADDYDELPTLSSEWIDETTTNLQRTLAVQDQDQFIADFYFDTSWARKMPLRSIPGLLDHH